MLCFIFSNILCYILCLIYKFNVLVIDKFWFLQGLNFILNFGFISHMFSFFEIMFLL